MGPCGGRATQHAALTLCNCQKLISRDAKDLFYQLQKHTNYSSYATL